MNRIEQRIHQIDKWMLDAADGFLHTKSPAIPHVKGSHLSRRELLERAGLAGAGLLLAGCGPLSDLTNKLSGLAPGKSDTTEPAKIEPKPSDSDLKWSPDALRNKETNQNDWYELTYPNWTVVDNTNEIMTAMQALAIKNNADTYTKYGSKTGNIKTDQENDIVIAQMSGSIQSSLIEYFCGGISGCSYPQGRQKFSFRVGTRNKIPCIYTINGEIIISTVAQFNELVKDRLVKIDEKATPTKTPIPTATTAPTLAGTRTSVPAVKQPTLATTSKDQMTVTTPTPVSNKTIDNPNNVNYALQGFTTIWGWCGIGTVAVGALYVLALGSARHAADSVAKHN